MDTCIMRLGRHVRSYLDAITDNTLLLDLTLAHTVSSLTTFLGPIRPSLILGVYVLLLQPVDIGII